MMIPIEPEALAEFSALNSASASGSGDSADSFLPHGK